MGTALVLGGSVIGSALALQLARSGWRVQVVDDEFDLFCGPDVALRPRPGAPHTVHAHGFMARALYELATRLPDVRDDLLDAGAPVVTLEQLVSPLRYDGGRPGDDALTSLRVRRITLDRVIGAALAREPGIERVVGRAAGLLYDVGSVPVVHGLVLRDGRELRADLVVDAAGRRSPVTGWLDAIGAAPSERVDRCRVRYYSRHFRLGTGEVPRPNLGFAEVHQFASFAHLLFLGDNDTATLALSVHDEDPVLRRARHPEAFTALAAANPAFARWHAALEPISPVFCLGALDNRLRYPAGNGGPHVLGLVQVGDALAMTNPTRGRGVAMGLAAAGRLHDLLVTGHAGVELALAYDAWVRDVLAVYYRETVASDAELLQRFRSSLFGDEVPRNAPAAELPEGHPVSSAEIERSAGSDADLFRVLLRATMLLDDERHIASSSVVHDVRRVLAAEGTPEPPRPRPTDGLNDRAVVAETLAAYA